MSTLDRARSLFSTKKRMRELSTSVVKHDRFDDGVLEDITNRAARFRETAENAPPVYPTVSLPARESYESDEDYRAALDATRERQLAAEEAAENYTGWQHDIRDTFRAYHTWDEPTVKSRSEIKPSRELGRQIMERLTFSKAFDEARPYTRHSDTDAAMATMAFSERLRHELETTLSEHVEASQAANEQEDVTERAERALDGLRERAKEQHDANGQVDPELTEQIKEQIRAREEAREKLGEIAEQIAGMPTGNIGNAVEQAADDAGDAAEIMRGLPGTGPGEESDLNPDQMFALAQKIKDNPTLRKITELMGRLRRDMKYARADRIQGGRDEPVDYEFGNHLADVIPSEMLYALHDDTRAEWLRKYVEASLMQTEYVGTERAGAGPVIVCVDGSGSMWSDMGGATRNEWARAVALSTVAIAHGEKRDAAVIEYSHGGQVKSWFFGARKALDQTQIIDCAGHFFGGGTDTALALAEANNIIARGEPFKHADLILVSDGEDYWDDDDRDVLSALKQKGVRVQAIGVGTGITPYLREASDHAASIMDMLASTDTARGIAEHITEAG